MRNELKLYIDTSVWNFALESERLECMITKKFLILITLEEFYLYLTAYSSEITQWL